MPTSSGLGSADNLQGILETEDLGWLIDFTSSQHNNGYINGGAQHMIFPGGHPSKYSAWST